MSEKKKEVATVPVSAFEVQQKSVEGIILQAIQQGTPVETMERILAMRKELKAEYAEEQFNRAMTSFQGKCPVIEKRKQGDKAKYAPLEDIIDATKALIAENGFSYRITSESGEDYVKAICTVTHVDGHRESSGFVAKVNDVQNSSGKSVQPLQQQFASALTFAKRYAFMNAFGIVTKNEDNDGGSPKASAGRAVEIEQAIQSCRDEKQLETVWRSLTPAERQDKRIAGAAGTRKAQIQKAAKEAEAKKAGNDKSV
jgi:hypothetical protein